MLIQIQTDFREGLSAQNTLSIQKSSNYTKMGRISIPNATVLSSFVIALTSPQDRLIAERISTVNLIRPIRNGFHLKKLTKGLNTNSCGLGGRSNMYDSRTSSVTFIILLILLLSLSTSLAQASLKVPTQVGQPTFIVKKDQLGQENLASQTQFIIDWPITINQLNTNSDSLISSCTKPKS